MKNLIRLFYDHITIAKFTCVALLFSPLWGLWWFNVGSAEVGVGGGVRHYFILQLCIEYLFKSIRIAIVYTSVCLLAFVGFVIVTFIRPAVIRVPLMLIMLIGWVFELSILDLTGTLSDQNLLAVLWQARSMPEVVGAYTPYIIRDWAAVVILSIVLCASPAWRFSVSGVFGLLPIVSGALVASVIVYTKGGTQVFPIPFGTFSNAAIVLASATNTPRSAVKPQSWNPTLFHNVVTNWDATMEAPAHPIFNKIVMIMDESVRGDYLSLNDETYNTTPFLKTTNHLVNFGVAISGGNCSYISRTMFRFGMRQSDLPNGWSEALNKPTFWELAHRVGYKTVHIEAWTRPPMNNFWLEPGEETLIDADIHIFENPGYLRDQRLVGKLLHALKEEGPAFIYVEKYGVHFPYSTKSPPDFHAFPASKASNTSNPQNAIVQSIATVLRSFLPRQTRDSEIATYPNAIAWSVDEFFKNLLPGVDLSKTLIIYTSDHGQNMLPGWVTHCSEAPVPPGEAYVPLFAITSVPEFEQRLEKGAAIGFGRFSHFEIFPTLLLAMGYDPGWVNRSYGPSLMDSPSPDRKFMIGSPNYQPMMIPADRDLKSPAVVDGLKN
jgi:lipid A ethanolaminephosphotransferase